MVIYYIIYHFIHLFSDESLLTPLGRRMITLPAAEKGGNSSILNLSTLMTSRRGSRQRTRMIVRTAVLPPRIF